MNRFLGVLILLLMLATLKALLVVLAVLLLLALTYSFIQQPKETLVFVAMTALGSVVSARPGLAIAGFTVVCVVGMLVTRGGLKSDSAEQHLSSSPASLASP